jgi:hypothetical protein
MRAPKFIFLVQKLFREDWVTPVASNSCLIRTLDTWEEEWYLIIRWVVGSCNVSQRNIKDIAWLQVS